MEKYLDITKPLYRNKFCQSLGTSLYQGSTVYRYARQKLVWFSTEQSREIRAELFKAGLR